MTSAPSTSYTNDLVGNRSSETTSSVTTTYTWHVLNRMTGRTNMWAGVSSSYVYRSDGLRVRKEKVTGSSSVTTDSFRYDGQMPFENERLTRTGALPTASIAVTRSALGARGVDAEEALTGTYTVSTGARSLNSTPHRRQREGISGPLNLQPIRLLV